jgi:hypothetical protein
MRLTVTSANPDRSATIVIGSVHAEREAGSYPNAAAPNPSAAEMVRVAIATKMGMNSEAFTLRVLPYQPRVFHGFSTVSALRLGHSGGPAWVILTHEILEPGIDKM